ATLLEVAGAVGSDVPSLLSGSACRVRGTGEAITPISAAAFDVVIVSTVPSSTAATYAAVAPGDMGGDARIARLSDQLEAGASPDDSLLGSALEAAAGRADSAVREAIERTRSVVPSVSWHMT